MAAHVFHQLYYHCVWTTHWRAPVLVGEIQAWMLRQVNEEAHKRGGILLAHNVMPDHVHLLVSLPPTICIATYVGQVKGASAFEHNKQRSDAEPLVWQEGYGAVTLAKSQSDKVAAYVNNQEQIHASRKTIRILEETEQTE